MPFSSPFPDLEIPTVDLWSFFLDKEDRKFGDQQRIFTDSITGRSYTYGDVKHLSVKVGQALKAAFSLDHGARISFFTTNNIDTAILTCAAFWAGVTACPANPQYTVPELTHQLKDSRVQVIITLASLLPTVRAAAKVAGLPESNIILLGDERHADFKHWTELPPAPHVQKAEINPTKDLSFIVYSSGTTGLPKGVMLTHYNIAANLTQFSQIEWNSSVSGIDKTLGILPFYHIYGLTSVLLSAISRGFEVFVMSSFDLERACKLIQDHHITTLSVPPPIVLNLAKSPIPKNYNLTSLRWITSGAAPLTRELAQALWDRLKIGTKQGYGMSETSPVVCVQYPDEWCRFAGSVGRLVPNMQAKIVDTEGREVEDGQSGEFLVRGPNVFSGYLNLPHLNKDIFTDDGFLRTGDVVYKDKYGMIYVTDRAKELIKYKGFQVPPAELEGLLVSHPDIDDACVIGIMDHSRASEVPRAYIVLRPGMTPSDALASDIQTWMASKVAPYKRLRGGVRWISQIPKSGAGKILRRVVKDLDRKETKTAKL